MAKISASASTARCPPDQPAKPRLRPPPKSAFATQKQSSNQRMTHPLNTSQNRTYIEIDTDVLAGEIGLRRRFAV
jgi:hypothetical protein